MKRFSLLGVLGACLLANAAYAQHRVINAIPINPAPSSYCDCGNSHPTPGHICTSNPGCNFAVIPSLRVGNTTRTPFNVEMPSASDCDEVVIKTPFYEKDIPVDGTIEVPKSVKNCIEKFLFEKKSYQLCGCTIQVCVPCAVECTDNIECRPEPTVVKLLVRVRTTPTTGARLADVWVEGVKGLPNPSVLGLQMTANQINTKFKTNVSF